MITAKHSASHHVSKLGFAIMLSSLYTTQRGQEFSAAVHDV